MTSWSHRLVLDQADRPDGFHPDLIRFGELRIYRDLRIRAMETALSDTIASGVIAVPSGYVEMKHAYIDGTPVQRLTRKTAEWVYQNYPTRSSGGKPKFFAREAGNLIFGPHPDSAYTVKGIYYKRLTALGTSNQTNGSPRTRPTFYCGPRWSRLNPS